MQPLLENNNGHNSKCWGGVRQESLKLVWKGLKHKRRIFGVRKESTFFFQVIIASLNDILLCSGLERSLSNSAPDPASMERRF